MIPHYLRFFAVSLTLLACLNGCATAPSPPPPPSPDYHLLLGELALLRDQRDIAAAEYAAAANALNDVGVARRATLLALHAGDIASARQAADRWEALAPADLEAAQYQGMLHARANDMAQAVQYLLRVTDGHAPQDPAAVASNLQVLTGLLVGEPNPWRSADLMAAIAHARSAQAVAWQGAALLALQADRPDQAAAFAQRALVLEPGVDDVRLLHARARLLTLPRPDAAGVLAPLAEWEHAADPGLRARYAGLLALAGRQEAADALYEDLLLSQPDLHEARLARALLALERQRFEVAEQELQELLKRRGRLQEAMFLLGVTAERSGRLEDAVDWYARVMPEEEAWLDAQNGIARVLLRLDGADAAQEFFARLREHWPEHRLLLVLNEAAVLVEGGQAARAVRLLDGFQPDSALDRLNLDLQLARAAAAAGQWRRAERVYRRLLEDDPGNPILQSGLGLVLLELDRRRDATALLESAQRVAPVNPAVLDAVGWLRYRQRRLADARALLEESWQRQAAPETGRHLLVVLRALKDKAAAEQLNDDLRRRFPGAATTENAT